MKSRHVGLGAVRVLAIVCVGLAAIAITFSSGCQTPGKDISVAQNPMCPDCKTITETSAIKGMDFTTYLCPGCKKEYEIDTSGGYLPPKVVYVCPKCKKMVQECPSCR